MADFLVNNPNASERAQIHKGSEIVRGVIVVVHDEESIDSIISEVNNLGGILHNKLRGIVNGFTAYLTNSAIKKLILSPEVNYIEDNHIFQKQSATFRTINSPRTYNLSSTDDGSSPSLSLGFTLDWFGTQYTNIYVNTNGGMVLDDGKGDFTEHINFDLRTASRPYILPLYTDLNPAANGTVEFGTGTISDGSTKNVFWAEWVGVAEYGNNSARQEFQALIIEESDGATVEFRYVDLTNAGSTTNSVFEVGFSDPLDSNNTVRIPDQNGDPSASELLSGKTGGSTGIWSYSVADSGSPSPAPTPTPTPTPAARNSLPVGPVWNLDRLDQRTLPLDNSALSHDGGGAGVTIYVVDSGIRTTHQEFAGRVVAGYDFVDDDSNPKDCDGHGTHIAGIAAGTSGVAPLANISAVRVLNCYGSGFTSDVIDGLNWVRTNHSSGDAVVLLASKSASPSKSVADAVTSLTSAGITVVLAAGNDNQDTANSLAALAPSAIAVGSTNESDSRSSFSNYGSDIDIFAPGQGALGAWFNGDNQYNTLHGTSQAAAHVAGAAALYLSNNPGSTPAQVSNALISHATTDVITDAGTGSPNRLLYLGRPTISITDDDVDDSLSAGDTSTLTFTLSDSSTDFIESDVSVSGGALSNWNAISSSSYTATFTPTDNSTTDGVISVATGVFSNSFGNKNADGSDSNNSVTFSINTTNNATNNATNQSSGAPCFASDSCILLANGAEQLVQNLRQGDKVVTHSGVREILWIGRKHFSQRQLKSNRRNSPIAFLRSSLEDNIPAKTLYVSEGHYFYINGKLIAAGCLVNGINIFRVNPNMLKDGVCYWHIDLGEEQLVRSNSCWSGSYYCWFNRRGFSNWSDYEGDPDHCTKKLDLPRFTSIYDVKEDYKYLLKRAIRFSERHVCTQKQQEAMV